MLTFDTLYTILLSTSSFGRTGATTFSITGVAIAQVTAHIIPHLTISQAVVELHLSNICSHEPIIPQATAHCPILQAIVGATLDGEAAIISQVHNTVLQNLAPALSQVVLCAISLASFHCSCIESNHRKPHTFHTCSVAIQAASTQASNTNFAAFLYAGKLLYLLFLTNSTALVLVIQSFIIFDNTVFSSAVIFQSCFSLFFVINDLALVSSSPSWIILS